MNKQQTPSNSSLVRFIKHKRLKIITIILILSFIASSAFYLNYSWTNTIQTLSKQALIIAETAAIGFNGEMLRQVKGAASDEGTLAYESLKNRLIEIPGVDRNIRFAYLFKKNNDKIYFVADSESTDSPDYSPPGQEYTEVDQQTMEPFINGTSVLTQPASDRWGTWVSALVPIKEKDGNVIAVFGIDYPVDSWYSTAWLNMIKSGIITLAVFVLLLAFFFIYKNSLKIKENEKNFRSFFEIIDDIIIISDSHGNIIYGNNATGDKLGYSIEEIQSKKIFDMCPKKKKGETEKIFNEIFSGRKNTCPLPLVRKNGKLLPVDSRVRFGEWSGDKCMFVVAKDLGAEQEALQKFNRIFENNPNLMVVSYYPDGGITDVNDTFVKKTGYTRDEVVGTTLDKLKVFIEEEKVKEIKEEITKNHFVHDMEVRVRTKSGIVLEGILFIELIESQGKEYFLTVIMDQTERKKALNQMQNIITATNAGTWELNIQTGKIIFDKRWAEIIGYTPKELTPSDKNTWEKLIHPDDIAQANKLLTECLSGKKKNYSCEVRMKHKDGSWVWVYESGQVSEWDTQGKPLKFFGAHINITTTKTAAEEIMKKNQELEEINNHMVGRELKMIEMKHEIESLRKQLELK